MKLIDNYLAAVADHLPRKNRDDIKAELQSTLYEQVEERSAALGRDLTEQEQVEFLRQWGHPLKVAGEYAPQQYLIGPALFPFYVYILKVIAIGLFLFHIALTVVVGVAAGDWAILAGDTVTRVVGSLLVMGAVVTIVFAGLERSGQRIGWAEQWNPLSLRDRARECGADRGDLITEIVSAFVVLLWWNGVLVLPTHLASGGASLTFARSPAWVPLFWPVNVLLAGSLVLGGVVLAVGSWRRASVALKLLIETASAAVVVYLLRAPELVELAGMAHADLANVQLWIGWSVRAVLWIVLAVILFDIGKYGRIALRLAGHTAKPGIARSSG